jgi:anti-anti-sigma factor
MDFDIQKTESNQVPIVRVMGALMDSEVYRFSRDLKAAAKLGAPKIAIDVSHTEFMDSHALGLLVFHHSALQKEGRSLVIINENPDPLSYIRGLLDTTGLSRILQVVDNVDKL